MIPAPGLPLSRRTPYKEANETGNEATGTDTMVPKPEK